MMKNGLLKALKSIHTKQHIEASFDLPEGFKSWGSTLVYLINVQDGIRCAGWKIGQNLRVLKI